MDTACRITDLTPFRLATRRIRTAVSTLQASSRWRRPSSDIARPPLQANWRPERPGHDGLRWAEKPGPFGSLIFSNLTGWFLEGPGLGEAEFRRRFAHLSHDAGAA
jgi:hypothetical protein